MTTAVAKGIFGLHSGFNTQAIQLVSRTSGVVSLHPKAKKHPLDYSKNYSKSAGSSSLPFGPQVSVLSGIRCPVQFRCAHTDVSKFPNFDYYRKDVTLDPTLPSSETDSSKKVFSYTVLLGGSVGAAYSAKCIIHGLLNVLGPSRKAMAEATTEIDLETIPEGKSMVFKWRNKPLFVSHRTDADIAREQAVNLEELRDPQKDEERVQDPKWLVLIGICTHLGCVPIAGAGDFGGYYCPCHGSHYDGSGRIRKGPAPLNLEVPEYRFEGSTLIVG